MSNHPDFVPFGGAIRAVSYEPYKRDVPLDAPKEPVPAHVQTRTLTETVWYPEHDPRKGTPEYAATHHHLIYELDEACWICGVRRSTGGSMETHHYWLEWALANSVDEAAIKAFIDSLGIPNKAGSDPWLRWFLDSEGNMLVLCETHHRGGMQGIHEITYPAWVAQK